MEIADGLIVGSAIRRVGKGVDVKFGVLGAALALLGCLGGNLLTYCGLIATENDIPFFTVFSVLDLEAMKNLIVDGFRLVDLIFYGIAVAEGYSLSIRRINPEEVEALLTHKQDVAN